MEALTRLVTESLVRHGFDRPLDYRRLHWSRWFRCESVHSLLFVPSKPGVFALAEEIAGLGASKVHKDHVETAASPALSEVEGAVPRSEASGPTVEDRRFSAASSAQKMPALAPEGRRMLAVTQFFEDDDMAFVLDHMLSRENPLRARLLSGRYFIRFVAIEDESQRRSICAALNQWMTNSAEKATGIGPHFATSLELSPATEYVPAANDAQGTLFSDFTPNREGYENREGHDFSRADKATQSLPASAAEGTAGATSLPSSIERSSVAAAASSLSALHLDSGAAANIHCPSPLPSGF